ncbi:MAG: hypothetical protein Q9195_007187 [Heterodermia aff. obscurata]
MGRSPRQQSTEKAEKAEMPEAPPNALDTIKEDPAILCRMKVLLYDLRNMATDRNSEKRTLSTTDELYISAPYFTSAQAQKIKTALVQVHQPSESSAEEDETGIDTSDNLVAVEEAIKGRLVNFFEKRRASGDARPCGPHDMAPIYEYVFGVEQKELKDEKFLARLRRCGLDGSSNVVKQKEGKKKKGR